MILPILNSKSLIGDSGLTNEQIAKATDLKLKEVNKLEPEDDCFGNGTKFGVQRRKIKENDNQ